MTRRYAVSAFVAAVMLMAACDERMAFDTHYVGGNGGREPDIAGMAGVMADGGEAGAEVCDTPRLIDRSENPR